MAKKRKNKHVLAPLSVKRALLKANRFHPLSADSNQQATTSSFVNNAEPNKQERPPPIIVTGKTYAEGKPMLDAIKAKDFALKIITIGVKIQFDNDEEYDAACTHFRAKNIEHFTHKKKQNKAFKAVMYGLPKVDLNEIKSYFKERLNIVPIALFEIKTKSNDLNNAIYLFHFSKKDISTEQSESSKPHFSEMGSIFAKNLKVRHNVGCARCIGTVLKIAAEIKYVFIVPVKNTIH